MNDWAHGDLDALIKHDWTNHRVDIVSGKAERQEHGGARTDVTFNFGTRPFAHKPPPGYRSIYDS
jgi:hypothetical protein